MASLSIVMPAYNEADHIGACIAEWYDGVIARIPESELVIVDDCSTDGMHEQLAALARVRPGLRVLRTPANVGHGRAVRHGLEQCRNAFVFQTDSDRQHHPEDFWRLWEARHAADFVFGVRERRADGAFRSAISGMLRLVNAVLWGRWIQDANCPFKLMRREALNALLREIPADTFIPMVMVSTLARHRGYRVTEIPVRHFARTAGQQSLAGAMKWAKVSLRCTRELASLRLALARRAVLEGRRAPGAVGGSREP